MERGALFWLSNEAWAAIEPHLPHGKPGKPRVDDRRVISGILHVLKVGCRWRDVPEAQSALTAPTLAHLKLLLAVQPPELLRVHRDP